VVAAGQGHEEAEGREGSGGEGHQSLKRAPCTMSQVGPECASSRGW
jgi:hypothetical protein